MTSRTQCKLHFNPMVKLVTLGEVKRSNIINMLISKIFIPNFVCDLTNIKKIENIFNRSFILLPKLCPGMRLQGAGEVKNFSVSICNGAPSTARSSYYLLLIFAYTIVMLYGTHLYSFKESRVFAALYICNSMSYTAVFYAK